MLPAIRDKSGFFAALCLAALGGYVTYAGTKLSYVSEVGPGPGFFPFWIGTGLLLFSCYQILLCLSAWRRAGESVQPNWHGSGRSLLGWLAMAASIFLFRWIGFSVSFILLTLIFIVVLDGRPVLHALGIGVALAL